MLTVYRHFDSASLHRGALGEPSEDALADRLHAQLERIYYALVAGFDVFGNVSHQVNVRRYMDYLRMEGELNFVHLLPPEPLQGADLPSRGTSEKTATSRIPRAQEDSECAIGPRAIVFDDRPAQAGARRARGR